MALIGTLPTVHDFASGTGPILPGGAVSAENEVKGDFNRVSTEGMPATSNDVSFGMRGVPGPRKGIRAYEGKVYDAGSEANSGSCAFIPKPPCGHPGVRDTGGAEGYAHVHAGIHGSADLNPHSERSPRRACRQAGCEGGVSERI